MSLDPKAVGVDGDGGGGGGAVAADLQAAKPTHQCTPWPEVSYQQLRGCDLLSISVSTFRAPRTSGLSDSNLVVSEPFDLVLGGGNVALLAT